MNKQGLLSVVFRVLGVGVLLQLIFGILSAVSLALKLVADGRSWPPDHSQGMAVLVVLALLAWGGVGLFLVLKGAWLASKFVKEAALPPLPDTKSLHKRLFAVTIRVLGLVYLVMSLPNVLQWMPPSRANLSIYVPDFSWPRLVTGIVALAVAAYLTLGGRLPERLAFRQREEEAYHETQ